MPYGDWVNDFPTGFFLAVHVAAFALFAAAELVCSVCTLHRRDMQGEVVVR